MTLSLLHLCDSLFPLGSFAYSDGLESATAAGEVRDAETLQSWLDAVLDETIARLEGPAVWHAWSMIDNDTWDALSPLDDEMIALRPSSAARRSTRAMGQRLLTMWRGLHPDPRLDRIEQLVRRGALAPTLPLAFAAACVSSSIGRRQAVEAFAYTRLASTVSAAMRLAPVGQTEAHARLARTLGRVPAVAADIEARDARPESFAPALDIAAMSQQYLHSRLFRS